MKPSGLPPSILPSTLAAMVRASFDTDRMACFLATRSELHAALPDWRIPLPVAVERRGKNPFTGKAMVLKTRDPGPDGPVTIPASLAFEHVLLPNEEDWESRYIALDLVLSGDDEPVPDPFGDPETLVAAMSARGLFENALLGGDWPYDPRWVLVVPQKIVAGLNALREDLLDATLLSWNLRSPSPGTLDDLRDLWTMARSATMQQREMFLWLDAPPHRCSRHRPHRG
jgi:hypothetical protein